MQIISNEFESREWASGKLVEYESLRVSNGRVESGRVGSKIVKLRVDMRVHTEKFQFFNVKYHAIIEIVECESGQVAKKWILAHSLEISNEIFLKLT